MNHNLLTRSTQEIGTTKISAYLDAYKTTMSQLALEKYPQAEVTFELKNRRGETPLLQYVDPAALQARLDRFISGWQPDEIAFLASQMRKNDEGPLYTAEFLEYLDFNQLPPVLVSVNQESGDIEVTTTGPWPLVTFWETVVMSEANEMYFENMVAEQGLDIQDIYDEGDRRLSEKIELLKSRPDIKFADFGTRRRFSYRWHKYVLQRLASECPDNLLGTSNIWLAHEFKLTPIGTYAHEAPMIYCGIAESEGRNPLEGHAEMLNDWSEKYGHNLSNALTDTYTSEFFFKTFTCEQAEYWLGLRHDSGDPIKFGEAAIAMYESYGIDPIAKTIVFSDGLDIETIVLLADYFKGKINVVFGWGTTLTNDLGIRTNNIVMKATAVNGVPTHKRSDEPGKMMGPVETINTYTNALTDYGVKA